MAPNHLIATRNLRTHGYSGLSVKCSGFHKELIAVAAGENFGINGNGSVQVFDINLPGNALVSIGSWTDNIFDVTWSGANPDILLSCSGDGAIQTWDINDTAKPLEVRNAHTREVSSIDWLKGHENPVFSSSSWDGAMRIWDLNFQEPLITLLGHQSLVYEATWSPLMTGVLASASGDGTVLLWSPLAEKLPFLTINSHNCEVLCCAWSNSDSNLIITGAADAVLRGWDIRNPNVPVYMLAAHQSAIKKVKCSPFHPSEISSVSFDFSTRLWDLNTTEGCVASSGLHTEFVYGLDYCPLDEGLIVDCSVDQLVTIYRAVEFPEAVML